VTIVTVSGYIDTTTAPELKQVVSEQVSLNRFKLVVDLRGVDYISSTGWGVFISELKDIRANGGDLVLVGMVTNVYNIYELMEFSTIIKSFNDIGSGTAYFLGHSVSSAGSVQAPAAVNPGTRPASQAMKTASSTAQGGKSDSQKGSLAATPVAKDVRNKINITEQTVTDKTSFYRNEALNSTGYTLGKAIVKVVMDLPYLSVKEIARALELPQYGGRKYKTHDVKHELKQMELLGKRERFLFVLNYRGTPGSLSL
jgi:anti-sigma B factor antagonist